MKRITFRDLVMFAVALGLVVFLIATARSTDQAPPVALPPQAPPVDFRYNCRCAETGVCPCINCDCPGADSYTRARAKAAKENRPLIVWRGWVCAACIAKLPEAVHVSVSGTDKRFSIYKTQCVTLSYFRDGELYSVAEIDPGPSESTVAALKAKLNFYGRYATAIVPFAVEQRPPELVTIQTTSATPAVASLPGFPGQVRFQGHTYIGVPAGMNFGTNGSICLPAPGRG